MIHPRGIFEPLKKKLPTYVNKIGNTLDLFITNFNKNIQVAESLDPLSIIDVYHGAQTISIKSKFITYTKTNTHKFNYTKGNYNLIRDNLSSINLAIIKSQTKSPNEFLNIIYKHLLEKV